MTIAYVGLGSNLDGPLRHVRLALDELDRMPATRVLARSSLYRSAPLGDQPAGAPAQDDFINAVARLDTDLAPEDLLDELQRLEDAHGRERPFANAPRTLDLDLLLYGTLQLKSERLTVPHPRLQERAFVLRPLLELDAGLAIPGLGPAGAWLPLSAGQRVDRLA